MKLLERHFEIALETPDGIKKLRELILALAMQGKLVPQNPNDQPASELLREIDENISHKIDNWKYLKLKKIFEFNYGKGVPKENISMKGFPVYGSNGPLKYSIYYLIENKCLIIGRKGSAGVINISDGPSWPSDVTYYVIPPRHVDFMFAYYLLINLNLPSLAKGIKPGLNRNEAYERVVGIPPLAEQKRIVAKIEQLMALCDKLEAERDERNEKRLTVHTAGMNNLLSAPDKTTFNRTWTFITNHFGELYSVPENVEDLKKAILQLAVMGKLVPQDPNDQPASELLKEIETEKKRLIKVYYLKTTAKPYIEPKEEYLGKPPGWAYCRLGNLAKFIDYRGKTPHKVESGIPLITAKNVRYGFINREPYEYITEAEYETRMTRGFPRKNDLLFTTEAPLGNIAIINIDEEFALAQRVICFQLHVPALATFLRVLIMSSSFQSQLIEKATGMTAKGIKASKLKEIPVPIPPLAEQKRIVAKIDQLMEICNSLEQQLKDSTDKQTAILNAVLAKM